MSSSTASTSRRLPEPGDLRRLGAEATPWMQLRLARNQLKKRRLVDAESALERLVAQHPDFVLGRGWLGVVRAQRGKLKAAISALEPVVETPEATVEMLDAYALCCCRGRRWTALHRFLDVHGDELQQGWTYPGGSRPIDAAFAAAWDVVAPASAPAVGVVQHMPFCAGTSLSVLLRLVYGRDLVVISRKLGQRDLGELLDGEQLPKAIRLHHPYPLDTSTADASWVTMLREPVGRFLSGFRKRLEPHRVPTLDFREAPSVEATIANAERWGLHDPMARELAILHPELSGSYRDWSRLRQPITVRFEEELDFWRVTEELPADRLHALAEEVLDSRFSVVGIVEHFDASYVSLGAAFGVRALPDPTQTGTSDASRHRPDAEQVRRVERLHEVDVALYATWRQRFEQRFEPVVSALAG